MKNPQDGSPTRKRKSREPSGVQRGKKRKLAATSDIPAISLDENDQDNHKAMMPSFKGTVWATAIPEAKEKKIYEPGMGERVALLGNWREVFRTGHRSSDEKGREDSFLSDSRAGLKPTTQTVLRSPRMKSTLLPDDKTDGSFESSQGEEDETDSRNDRKGRRVSNTEDWHSPPKHKVVVEIPLQRAKVTQKNEKQNDMVTTAVPPSTMKRRTNNAEDKSGTVPKPRASRKRRADDAEDEKTNDDTSKPRAKRIASTKPTPRTNQKQHHVEDKNETAPNRPPPPPPPSTRKRRAKPTDQQETTPTPNLPPPVPPASSRKRKAGADENTNTNKTTDADEEDAKPRPAKRVEVASASVGGGKNKDKGKEKQPPPPAVPTARTTRNSRKK